MNFTAKKVAILGLGIEGQDLCQFLLIQKAQVSGFDQKTKEELGETASELEDQGVRLCLGKDYLQEGLSGFEFIFRSPGIRPWLPALLEAKKQKIPVTSATQLFFDLCPGKVIGVTGTKGKGTAATLIYRVLKEAGKKVFLVGNIGKPALKILPRLTKDSWVVYELSSFQLQDLTKSPHIAVVLFITSEHLDYHRSTKEYVEAKMPIVKFQTKKDKTILNADNLISSGFALLTPASVYQFSRLKKVKGAYINNKKEIVLSLGKAETILGETKNLKLLGEHNWENVTAAAVAASLAGASTEKIRKVTFSFSGLEHRLEIVAKLRDVVFYNDSFSTIPETTIAAIKSFSQPVVLIAGGSEKKSDFTKLGRQIVASSVESLILIGEMASRIEVVAKQAGFQGQIVKGLKSMGEIVKTSLRLSSPGGVVLLSPACASFDMFRNYKDRGEQFKKQVLSLHNPPGVCL